MEESEGTVFKIPVKGLQMVYCRDFAGEGREVSDIEAQRACTEASIKLGLASARLRRAREEFSAAEIAYDKACDAMDEAERLYYVPPATPEGVK